jgi:hypothetical protein
VSTSTAELRIDLQSLFGESGMTTRQAIEAFAVLNLGFIESLRSGAMRPGDAISRFYCAANCIYVRRKFKNEACDDIMGRGVQLPDLFDALPAAIAKRQFAIQLDTMGRLCLKLLKQIHPKPRNGAARTDRRRRAG